MTFKRAFLRWHAAAGQQAEDMVDKHIDTTVDLELAIREGQKHAADLVASASNVIAQKELAEARLTKAQRTVTEAENNARAASRVEQQRRESGDAAGADQAHTQAVLMATQVAGARSAVEVATHAVELATANAAAAQRHIEEEQEALQGMLAKKNEIQGVIDSAKMEEAMNASMASLTSAHETIAPTLDQVEAKAQERLAAAHATSTVQATDTAVVALDIHHEALAGQAEDILAELNKQDA